jgi:RNA polymerase sigma factor (sigma-70 family)
MKSKEQDKQLFLRHYRELFATAFFLLHNEEESRDAVQEVFVRLLENDTVLREDTARNYLLTAVRHYCLNRLNSLSVEERLRRECLLEERTSETNWQQTEHDASRLHKAIEILEPPTCRNIVQMHYRDRLKFHEVAELLNIS